MGILTEGYYKPLFSDEVFKAEKTKKKYANKIKELWIVTREMTGEVFEYSPSTFESTFRMFTKIKTL